MGHFFYINLSPPPPKKREKKTVTNTVGAAGLARRRRKLQFFQWMNLSKQAFFLPNVFFDESVLDISITCKILS